MMHSGPISSKPVYSDALTMENNYFQIYNLAREPFSSDPDPEFLYKSRQHFGTLQHIENAIRNRSCINLIIGDTGTGKSMLLAHLHRQMSLDKSDRSKDVVFLTICDNEDEQSLEHMLSKALGHQGSDGKILSCEQVMEQIRQREKKLIVLIDDGHKITKGGFEFLFRLADLVKNGENIVQCVIAANRNLLDLLTHMPDFKAEKVHVSELGPLSFKDTRLMISHRLKIAGNTMNQSPFFSAMAYVAIYLFSGGYPKRIVALCRQLVSSLGSRKTMKAGWLHVVLYSGLIPPYLRKIMVLVVALSLFAAGGYGFNTLRKAEKNDNPISQSDVSKQDPEVIAPASDVLPQQRPDKEELKTDPVILNPPETLGKVIVKPSDSFLIMLEKVYGHSRPRYREAATRANPQIRDINHLKVGDRVDFPPIVAKVSIKNPNASWIRVAGFSTLPESMEFVRTWPSDAPRIKIIPFFRKDSGLNFNIVIKEAYMDRASFKKAFDNLPFEIAPDKERVQFPMNDVVYYSDPFFN